MPEVDRQAAALPRGPAASAPSIPLSDALAELADGLTAAAAYMAAILHELPADDTPHRAWAVSCQAQLHRCRAAFARVRSAARHAERRTAHRDPLFRAEPWGFGWAILEERLNCPAVIGAQRQENLTETAALAGAALLNGFVGSQERRDHAFLEAAQRLSHRLAFAAAPGEAGPAEPPWTEADPAPARPTLGPADAG